MCVELVSLRGFFTLFIYCPWFTFLSLSFRFVTSPSFFRRSSDSVASPFHSATGSPFGPSPFLFSIFAAESLHSSFTSLRPPIDLSLCLHPPASLPPLLQSAVPYCYFLSSRGFSFLPPACSQSPSCVRCPSRFTICYFPRGASLRSLLLSSFLRFLRGLLSFWWTFSSFLLGLGLVFIGNFFTYWVPYLSLGLFPVSFLRLLGFPSVRPPLAPLLGLARFCPCVLLFPLLCDSVES